MTEEIEEWENEEWRNVIGFEGLYAVSSFGRVRSITRMATARFVSRVYGGKMLNPAQVKGYRVVSLRRPGEPPKTKYVHTLVLESFVEQRTGEMQACHRDGDKENNRLSNLYWGTVMENANDKRKHGTLPVGEKCGSAKLTAEQVIEIRKKAEPIRTQAHRYGVSTARIEQIRAGQGWRHV